MLRRDPLVISGGRSQRKDDLTMFYVQGKMTVSSQNSKLQAALTVVKAAQAKAENKEYPPALEKYELALGALIPLLQNEVNSPQNFRAKLI